MTCNGNCKQGRRCDCDFYITPKTWHSAKPNYNITFSTDKVAEIGRLDFNGPAMKFTGNAEESARVFFDWLAKYFAERLKQEREPLERELAAERVRLNGMGSEREARLMAQLAELKKAAWKAHASMIGMREQIEDWGGQVDEYFQQKYKLSDDLKNAKAAIEELSTALGAK